MLGWGILIMIGAMVARYGRQWDPAWFYVHTGVQLLAFTLGIIGVICGFLLDSRLNVDVSTHKGLGIFILVLGSLQVCHVALLTLRFEKLVKLNILMLITLFLTYLDLMRIFFFYYDFIGDGAFGSAR